MRLGTRHLFVLGPQGEAGEQLVVNEAPRRRRVGQEACQKVLDSISPGVLERLPVELVEGPSVGMGLGAGKEECEGQAGFTMDSRSMIFFFFPFKVSPSIPPKK